MIYLTAQVSGGQATPLHTLLVIIRYGIAIPSLTFHVEAPGLRHQMLNARVPRDILTHACGPAFLSSEDLLEQSSSSLLGFFFFLSLSPSLQHTDDFN